jgi:GH24 family phage-related lysozyme (muramidase)
MSQFKTYKDIVKPMLEKSEGFRDEVYYDKKNNPTIGFGTNLNDAANVEQMRLNNISIQDLFEGKRLTREQAEYLRDMAIERKEKELRESIGNDMFDNVDDNKKASLMSLMYNSNKLIGPKIKEYLGTGDHLGVAKEMLTGSNKEKDLGTLLRRADEASNYLGHDETQLNDLFKLVNLENEANINGLLNKSDNEPMKKEFNDRYGKYLKQPIPTFKNLFNK